MRSIKKQHKALSAPIADLVTMRALPTQSIDYIDPFLFLNHHGPQVYKPHNRGLPFGPHPHRGFETVTFILAGDIMHKDSSGAESVIEAGGVQWMTAGKGLIHAEVSSEAFKQKGGPLEILQLWVNLPARLKLTEPKYVGLQKEAIPTITLDEGRIMLEAVSGNWEGQQGAFEPHTDIALAVVRFKQSSRLEQQISADRNIFFYTISGRLTVNGQETQSTWLTEFNNDGSELHIEATSDAVLLLGHAMPFHEPVVSHGPFVMNTASEIQQAYQEYREGKFGSWADV